MFDVMLYSVSEFSIQSEDDTSLSGIAVTALFFDRKAQLLVSGDQSGTVNSFFILCIEVEI